MPAMNPWLQQTPFQTWSSHRPADIWTDAVFQFLHSHGIHTFSVSALARELRVTPAAVLQRQSRRDLLSDVVLTFGARWLWWSLQPSYAEPIPGRLPSTDHELHAVRVWQALCEVARGAAAAGDPELLEHVRWVRTEESAQVGFALDRLLDRPPEQSELDLTLVLLDGLRRELAAPDPRITLDQARDVLVRHVEGLREQQPD
jgi:hypothetical protein